VITERNTLRIDEPARQLDNQAPGLVGESWQSSLRHPRLHFEQPDSKLGHKPAQRASWKVAQIHCSPTVRATYQRLTQQEDLNQNQPRQVVFAATDLERPSPASRWFWHFIPDSAVRNVTQ
jgi:hypothetical protein